MACVKGSRDELFQLYKRIFTSFGPHTVCVFGSQRCNGDQSAEEVRDESSTILDEINETSVRKRSWGWPVSNDVELCWITGKAVFRNDMP